MTTGEKLSNLRKQNNYTQENLADLLGVSRQAISKWESDQAYPETDKLIKLANLYHCSCDYLLKDEITESTEVKPQNKSYDAIDAFFTRGITYTSKKKIGNMPLVDINFKFTGVAKGFIAIGFRAKGVISVGALSMGILSFGALSLGIIGFGALSLGLIALGAISLGVFALGAIAIGIFALGAIAIGFASGGALSIGYYFSYGDYAYSARCSIFKTVGKGTYNLNIDSATHKEMVDMVNKQVPVIFRWFAKIFI